MQRFSTDMLSSLYGNPHSGSVSSQLSTKRIEDVRLQVLQFFNADPEDFDVVFVANATAGMKLVMDSFRSVEGGFDYIYHKDSHTSLIGIRENATRSQCFGDAEVESWLANSSMTAMDYGTAASIGLFAYPAQSNMDGRKLPLDWIPRVRELSSTRRRPTYTLLDAAALVATSPLDLNATAPDFTVLSFNKIFGFPDLGALIVRKSSGDILRNRKYFGGGTVEMVLCIDEQCHAFKEQSLHEILEDGTLAIHSIMALQSALDVHLELFENMNRIANHTMLLAKRLWEGLESLRHANGQRVCKMYSRPATCGRPSGPTIALNLMDSKGTWISNAEVEKLAAVKQIHLRVGGLCNPGGVATALDLSKGDIRNNFSAGFRCGNDNDIMRSGKPTGVIRISLGAMSIMSDVTRFIDFIKEFYVDSRTHQDSSGDVAHVGNTQHVESLTVYPIKSCGGFSVPPHVDWEVRPEGLAWDREWCLVHQGTGQALSQKRYPRMALLRPIIDFETGLLKVRYAGEQIPGCQEEISVPLSGGPEDYESTYSSRTYTSRVCGDSITARNYTSRTLCDFFSRVLDVPCTLARFPAGGTGYSARHAKAHMQRHQRHHVSTRAAGTNSAGPPTPPDLDNEAPILPILLSNESPILMINKASIMALNSAIAASGGKLASPYVFRANIVIAGSEGLISQPYSEDHWSGIRIGEHEFKMLGSCRRCHMVCVDQDTAIKNEEPFVTLAKTRRYDGKVFFGSHMCHVPNREINPCPDRQRCIATIRVGNKVEVLEDAT